MEEYRIAGMEPGGLTNTDEIRVLLCYLLKNLKEPVTFELLNEILMENPVANYFEVVSTFRALVESGHIRVCGEKEGSELYEAAPLARRIADELQRTVPRSVRERVVASALELQARARREQENRAEIKKVGDGYTVHCRILDIGTDLLEFTLFVPDIHQAQVVRERFLTDPQTVYLGLLEHLTEYHQDGKE
ncbi:MAG: DUF4364 family protein [Oscillospiraceae bacterium]|jgi:hypothetical protein|nr:DUF4364 family protein [Oscillospiraceae bacterium]